MYARLFLALFVSIALVGGALWIRLSNNAKVNYELTIVEPEIEDGKLVEYFLEPASKTTPKRTETPSATDLLGQRLLLDYIGLATDGKATEEGLTALANKHVESVSSLTQAEFINYEDLKTVSSNKTSLQKYADQVTKIHEDYAKNISGNYKGFALNTLNPELYSFAAAFGSAYREAALKLKNIPVPAPLAQSHLQLVNSYLSSAAAMKAISQTEKDSAKAFAGIVVLNDNLNKESLLLDNIGKILTSNGI